MGMVLQTNFAHLQLTIASNRSQCRFFHVFGLTIIHVCLCTCILYHHVLYCVVFMYIVLCTMYMCGEVLLLFFFLFQE